MTFDRAAVVDKRLGAKIRVVLREVAHQAETQRCHIASGRDLGRIGKARGVDEGGAAHSDGAGGAGHALGEGPLRAAKIFGNGGGDIIGRFDDQGTNGGFDSNAFPRLHAELGRRHRGSTGRHADGRRELDLAGLQIPEQDIKRHHLGE